MTDFKSKKYSIGQAYSAGQNQATHAKLNHTTNIPKSRSF